VSEQYVTIGNAATGALIDVLEGTFGAVDGPFVGMGDLGTSVAAGEVDNTSLSVEVNTSAAGVFNGHAELALRSHNDDMADLDLAPVGFDLAAQINHLANPEYVLAGGAGILSGGGQAFTLNLGTVAEGSTGLLEATLGLLNDQLVAVDPLSGIIAQDSLNGNFGIATGPVGGDPFDFANFVNFLGLTAGSALTNLLVSFDPTGLLPGLYSAAMGLDPLSTYAGLSDYDLADVRLIVMARVVGQGGDVPEPSIILLFVAAGASLLWVRRRRYL